jgi:hypothetical protein
MRERGNPLKNEWATPALLILAATLLSLFWIPACRRSDRYAQARELVTRYADALDAFSTAVEKAKDAKSVVAALNIWADEAQGLAPQIKALGKSRPELAGQSSLPADLQALLARLDAAHARMLAAMEKAMQYADNPAVPAARARLENVQKIFE